MPLTEDIECLTNGLEFKSQLIDYKLNKYAVIRLAISPEAGA